jgi:hypothetical protein
MKEPCSGPDDLSGPASVGNADAAVLIEMEKYPLSGMENHAKITPFIFGFPILSFARIFAQLPGWVACLKEAYHDLK